MAEARSLALQAVPLLDLATSSPADADAVHRLCAAARTRYGPVASVTVGRGQAALARAALRHSTVRVAVSVPGCDPGEVAAAVAEGPDEIEVAFPDPAFLAGDAPAGAALVRACRAACRRSDGPRPLLKVVLEAGSIGDPAAVGRAATLMIDAGADLLVTASGRYAPGASLATAELMLSAIAAARQRRLWAGIKVAGGIRSLADAERYMMSAHRMLGAAFVGPASFRLEGAALLDELLAVLAAG
jgi:deoxyribose-phosphate aldolase